LDRIGRRQIDAQKGIEQAAKHKLSSGRLQFGSGGRSRARREERRSRYLYEFRAAKEVAEFGQKGEVSRSTNSRIETRT
jgi:hypothetical protein